MKHYFIVFSYHIRSFVNRIKSLSKWKKIKNLIFFIAILILLSFLYLGFWRILNYLKEIDIIGMLLIWKLSAMVLLINFFMIAVSSLIISMTTLFYSSDLKFLLSLPISQKAILLDKILLSVFYSSWSLAAIMLPYVIAMIKVCNFNFSFILAFIILLVPYAFLASYFGIFFSIVLMYFFPSSRTRDTIWLLSSFSFAGVYMSVRFSKPEKFLNPDALGIIANYLSYLQAPTAPYLPSWWFTKSLIKFSNGDYSSFLFYLIFQYLLFLIISILIIYIGGKIYIKAFSGAQNTLSNKIKVGKIFEFVISKKLKKMNGIFMFIFKERKNFIRDVRYYSQTILVFALSMVYIFSIKNIPVDGQDVKNFIAFINIIISGFVISALALRFVFTSISIEDGSIWVVKTLPINASTFLYSKLIFYFSYILIFSLMLVGLSGYYLCIDEFMFSFSIFISVIMSFFICCLAISMGAIFPDFNIENIHYIESSYGGFLFMAASVAYTIGVAVWFAYPMKIYFMAKYLKNSEFDTFFFYSSVIIFLLVNVILSGYILKKAIKRFESMEV
ncbi:MAG: hypothetical protein N2Z20_05655 [Elusimicrobiales bacterium]|nr:hypothetical protein [Elusimicrobiales bacterium]